MKIKARENNNSAGLLFYKVKPEINPFPDFVKKPVNILRTNNPGQMKCVKGILFEMITCPADNELG
jgi:hypothetical protein